jgi:hypothetical protein
MGMGLSWACCEDLSTLQEAGLLNWSEMEGSWILHDVQQKSTPFKATYCPFCSAELRGEDHECCDEFFFNLDRELLFTWDGAQKQWLLKPNDGPNEITFCPYCGDKIPTKTNTWGKGRSDQD